MSAVGGYASAVIFTVGLIAFVVLQASFRTWTVGQFVQGRAGIFVDLFCVVFILSFLTLLVSCFGEGRARLMGIICSVLSLLMVCFVFGTNR